MGHGISGEFLPVQHRGESFFLTLLSMLLVMQPSTRFALFATRAHC